jgi:short subunit dehydrogenase-like uncharacterized protein
MRAFEFQQPIAANADRVENIGNGFKHSEVGIQLQQFKSQHYRNLDSSPVEGPGVPCKARGSRPAKLERLLGDLGADFETVLVDVSDPSTIPRAFEGSDVVINCAGPFTDFGVPVVAEAARRGVHYVDTTGEQGFIRRVFEQFDPEARSTGAALVPACAFEYALGDAAAELAAEDLQPCDEVEIAYAIEGFGSTRGTKKSIIKAISTDGCQHRNSTLVQSRPSDVRREVNFPGIGRRSASSFPAGEVIMVPRHIATQNVTTLMVLPIPPLIAAAASLMLPAILRSPLRG